MPEPSTRELGYSMELEDDVQASKTIVDRREFLRVSTLAAGVTMAGALLNGCATSQHARSPKGFPKPTMIQSNGIRMAVYARGDGFPVVFSHGFPELGYSWRNQLSPVAEAGFHAIAPDQRGYGQTSRPDVLEEYDIHHLCGDLVGILDHFGHEKAVFCGHDWGGFIVWMMPLLHPDRVAGVVGVNTPYFPRPPMSLVDMIRKMRGEDNYIVWFQKPNEADELFEQDIEKVFRLFMRKNGITAEEFAKLPQGAPERNFEMRTMLINADVNNLPGELVMSESELAYYINAFEKSGFTGGMNWYRNLNRNWATTADLPKTIDVPCLYVGAEDDVVLPPSSMNTGVRWIPDLERHTIMNCGHWTQQEHPEEFNRILIDWLQRRFA